VNGQPAALGQRVGEDDTIAVDGRRLRRERAAPAQLVLMYHRPAGEALRPGAAAVDDEGTARSTYERLPAARGRRWLPLSPLAPSDGGLELFTTDGDLRAAASRVAHELPSAYAIRVRGEPTPELLASLPGLALARNPPLRIDSVAVGGGEARNRWLELSVRGARGRDLRALLADHGLEVGRVLRVRFGPIALDPALARVRHRELAGGERDALYEALGLPRPGARRRTPRRRAGR
jgi:23S rRNA pseudouridine2605 synthase